jgi:hypothetical protein
MQFSPTLIFKFQRCPLPLTQFRGALFFDTAEIIPIEPDPDNAGEGKTVSSLFFCCWPNWHSWAKFNFSQIAL